MILFSLVLVYRSFRLLGFSLVWFWSIDHSDYQDSVWFGFGLSIIQIILFGFSFSLGQFWSIDHSDYQDSVQFGFGLSIIQIIMIQFGSVWFGLVLVYRSFRLLGFHLVWFWSIDHSDYQDSDWFGFGLSIIQIIMILFGLVFASHSIILVYYFDSVQFGFGLSIIQIIRIQFGFVLVYRSFRLLGFSLVWFWSIDHSDYQDSVFDRSVWFGFGLSIRFQDSLL